METTYKGWTIRESDNLWCLAYGLKYEVNNDEKIYHFHTLEEAKEFIDDLTNDCI